MKSPVWLRRISRRRGAVVRATDLKRRRPPRRRRTRHPFAQHARSLRDCDLIVLSRRARGSASARSGPPPRRAGHRRSGTRRALPQGPHYRHHRLQRKTTTTSLIDTRVLREAGRHRPGRRQYRPAGHRHGRILPRRWVECPRTLQLPDGDDSRFSRAHRALRPQRHAKSPGSPPHLRRTTLPPRAASSRLSTPAISPC